MDRRLLVLLMLGVPSLVGCGGLDFGRNGDDDDDQKDDDNDKKNDKDDEEEE